MPLDLSTLPDQPRLDLSRLPDQPTPTRRPGLQDALWRGVQGVVPVFNPAVRVLGQQIEQGGQRIGQFLGAQADRLLAPQPRVNLPGLFPRIQMPSDAELMARSIPGAIAETLPTEAARFVTPQALATQALTIGALRGLASTPLGQMPLETLPGLGFLRRFNAPELFAPLTRPKPVSPYEVGVQEAQIVKPPRALPSPETVGSRLDIARLPDPPRPTLPLAQPIGEGLPPPQTLPSLATPSPTPFTHRPLVQLMKARQEAVQAVLSDLREQSDLLGQSAFDLKRRVMAAGGIRPTVGGGLREELHAIRPFLRLKGRAIDDVATELGFEDGEQLRTALLATRGLTRPTQEALRQEAARIVDTEPGQQILHALQAKGASEQSIKRIVRDVTSQMTTSLSEGQRALRTILTTAQQKNLTPAQVARVAREQRVEPGAVAFGPRGGVQEAPLEAPDIRRIAATTEQIVPRQITPFQRGQLSQGFPTRLPGGPNQPPPRLPRKRTLVPYYPPGRFHDLNEWQVKQFSGLEPRRAMALIDRSFTGPTTERWLRLRSGELAAGIEHQRLTSELTRLAGRMPERSPLATQVTGLLENTLTGTPDPRAVQTAAWLRQNSDAILDRINQVKASLGKPPIAKRQDYMTHLTSPDLWAELRALATGEDVAQVKTLGDLVPEALQPTFRFGKPRTGGPYAIDPLRAFQVYSRAALRVLHLAEPSAALKAHADQLPPLARAYVRRVIQQTVTGWPGGVAEQTPAPLRTGIRWLSSRFAKGTVLGNFSSVLMQPWTLPNTMARLHQPQQAGIAALWLSRREGWQFAEQWSSTLQGRLVEGLDPGILSGYRALEHQLAAAMTGLDRTMVAHNFLSHYLDQRALGRPHAEAVAVADRETALAQAEFLKSTLAPVFADEVARGFVMFQTTVNNTFNFVKTDLLQPGQDPAAFWRGAALFAGTTAALWALYEALGLPHPGQGRTAGEGMMDWIPGFSTFRGGPPIVRIGTDLVRGLTSPRPDEQERARRSFLRTLGVIAIGPGSNQLFKSLAGIQAVAQGGKFNRAGRQQFPVSGVAEQARAVLGGPYQTRVGQRFLREGPPPIPPEQKALNAQLRAFRQRMRGR